MRQPDPVGPMEYLLKAGDDPSLERRRLKMLARLRDPSTLRRLRSLGVGAGWRCLEVGAGAGTVVRWLSETVGRTGQVVATDIDTRHLQKLAPSNVEIRRHDLLREPLEVGGFDLVFARALLHHLPGQQDDAVARLVSALRPGGWLLLEEPDVIGATELQSGPWGRVLAAFTHLPQADYTWARSLPALVVAHGLVATGAEGHFDLFAGGSDVAEFYRLSLEVLRDALLATGAVHADLITKADAELRDNRVRLSGCHCIAAWGRSRAD